MSWWQTEAEGIQAPQLKLVCGVFLHVAEGTEGKKERKQGKERKKRKTEEGQEWKEFKKAKREKDINSKKER